MVKDIIPELVVRERIQGAGIAVDGPVAIQFLRAKNQDTLVAQFEILDDRKSSVGLSQTDAVRENAAVVVENLVDRCLGAVLLEGIKGAPDVRVWKGDPTEILVEVTGAIEEIAEEVEEREIVDELRRLVRVELPKIEQDVLLHTLDEIFVVPDLSEPLLQLLAVAGAIDDEVEFDVVASLAKAKTAHGEIGTPEDGVLHSGGGDVIHLSVKKVGLLDGLDVHLALNPVGALPGDTFLLELVGEFQAVGVDDEGFLRGLARVEAVDEGRFAEKKIEVFDAVEFLLERVVGVDGEVGRDDGEPGAGADILRQELGDFSTRVVVAQAGIVGRRWHSVGRVFRSGQLRRPIGGVVGSIRP